MSLSRDVGRLVGAIAQWVSLIGDQHDWVVIDDAGHSVAWEKPQVFNAAVLAFLRQH
jgi:pimeloyl-ACP methyl ester carboxylesterase